MQKPTKVCYLISDIDKAVAFEWIVENIDPSKFELSFILFLPNGNCDLENYLQHKKVQTERIRLSNKADIVPAITKCTKHLIKLAPEIVHCHLRKATLIGLLAAKLLGIRKRIYTRHHSTFHHEYHPQAVKWDHLANSLATDVVAISKNVREVLEMKENVPSQKINLIHHGFDLDKFSNVPKERIELLRRKYLPDNFTGQVIGIIGRYIHLKGHKYILEAIGKLIAQGANIHIILANATGPDEKEIHSILQKNIPTKNYTEIKFERDLFALYQLFDVYVHCPINATIEAFGQTYVEALAAGIPSIFTLSGIANEFIENGKNALVVPYMDSQAIAESIMEIMEKPELGKKLIENGKRGVDQFRLEIFIEKLEDLYLS